MPRIFPGGKPEQNKVICFSVNGKDFYAIAADRVFDWHFTGDTQCLRYTATRRTASGSATSPSGDCVSSATTTATTLSPTRTSSPTSTPCSMTRPTASSTRLTCAASFPECTSMTISPGGRNRGRSCWIYTSGLKPRSRGRWIVSTTTGLRQSGPSCAPTKKLSVITLDEQTSLRRRAGRGMGVQTRQPLGTGVGAGSVQGT